MCTLHIAMGPFERILKEQSDQMNRHNEQNCKKTTVFDSQEKTQELWGINQEFWGTLGILNVSKTNQIKMVDHFDFRVNV